MSDSGETPITLKNGLNADSILSAIRICHCLGCRQFCTRTKKVRIVDATWLMKIILKSMATSNSWSVKITMVPMKAAISPIMNEIIRMDCRLREPIYIRESNKRPIEAIIITSISATSFIL